MRGLDMWGRPLSAREAEKRRQGVLAKKQNRANAAEISLREGGRHDDQPSASNSDGHPEHVVADGTPETSTGLGEPMVNEASRPLQAGSSCDPDDAGEGGPLVTSEVGATGLPSRIDELASLCHRLLDEQKSLRSELAQHKGGAGRQRGGKTNGARERRKRADQGQGSDGVSSRAVGGRCPSRSQGDKKGGDGDTKQGRRKGKIPHATDEDAAGEESEITPAQRRAEARAR